MESFIYTNIADSCTSSTILLYRSVKKKGQGSDLLFGWENVYFLNVQECHLACFKMKREYKC